MTEEKKKLPEEAEQDHAGATAEERTIIAVMKRKWGEKNVEDFSKRCPDAYSLVVRELSAEMEYFVKEWHDPGREHRHEHVKSLFAKTVTRWVLMRVSQALIAHLINHAQGIKETEKNFFTEYQSAFPYIEEALTKHPDAPGHMGPGTKQQVDVFIWEINEEDDDIGAVYNGTFDTPCSAVLKDAAEAIRKDREAARTADKKKLLPQIYGEKPKTILVPNSAFANALRGIDGKGELIGAGPVDIAVMNQGKPNEITIYAEAWIDEGYTLTTNKPYTGYDEAVLAVVASYYVDSINKNTACIVTDSDIYRTLNDMKTGVSISANQRAEVAASMKKVNNIWGRLNATDQLKKYKVTDQDGNPVEGLAIEGRLLEFRIIKVVVKGKIQQAYLIKDEPITYTHSKLTKQVITFPRSLLDVKETRRVNGKVELLDVSLSNTRARTAAKMYILKRIGVMKNDEARAIDARRKEVNKCVRENKAGTPSKPRPIAAHRKQSRVILFDTLFNAAEITSPSRKTDMKKYVFSMLDFLEGKEVITSWKARKGRGKTADAVEITV